MDLTSAALAAKRRRAQAVNQRQDSRENRVKHILADDMACLRMQPNGLHDLSSKDPDKIMVTWR